MEYAYRVKNVAQLIELRDRIDSEAFPDEIKDLNASFIHSMNGKPITMVYFGAEFCQNAMPQENEIDKAVNWCTAKGKRLSIYIPPLNDDGIKKADRIISMIDGTNVEISVNEIGILELIREKNYRINISLGRIFDKAYKDARLNMYDLDVYCNSEGRHYFQSMSHTSSYYKTFMDAYDVSGVEIDYPLYGKMIHDNNIGIVSYFPYGVFSTGRVCLFGHFFGDKEGRNTRINQCKRYCTENCIKYNRLQSSIKMDNSGRRVRELNMYRSGNTLYYAVDSGNDNGFYNRVKRLVINYKS